MRGIEKADFVITGLRNSRGENRALLSAVGVSVVSIIAADRRGLRIAEHPVALILGLVVIHHDSRKTVRFDDLRIRSRGRRRRCRKDLTIRQQPRAELRLIHVLHTRVGVDRQAGGDGRVLAADHEDRLHPDTSKSRVRGGQRERDEQVLALGSLRNDRPVADRRGPAAASAKAFVVEFSIVIHSANGVDVHRIRRQRDAVRRDLPIANVMLGHHEVADHPSRLAHINLMRPIAVVGELVLRQTETRRLLAHVRRHAWIGAEKMKQATQVILVRLRDPRPVVCRPFRPAVGAAEHVGRNRPPVVEVKLAVRQRVVFAKRTQRELPAALCHCDDVSSQQFPLRRIVVRRWLQRRAVRRIVRQTKPEVVGLNPLVRRAGRFRRAACDQRQQPAGRIARLHEWIHVHRETSRRRSVLWPTNPVDRFVVLFVRLAPNRVTHARERHQIALVGGVDKHLRGYRAAILKLNPDDAFAILHD